MQRDIFDIKARAIVIRIEGMAPEKATTAIAQALRMSHKREHKPVIDPKFNDDLIRLWNAKHSGVTKGLMGPPVVIPGLQASQFGERSTSFMLTCSLPDFYEGVVIAQMATAQHRSESRVGGQKSVLVLIPHDERDLSHQTIEFTPEQISQVLGRWGQQQSISDLPFVKATWGSDGKEDRLR